jgi:preprotein translocase subunit Sec61beta
VITEVIELTGASLLDEIKLVPGIAGNEQAYEAVVAAGQIAYSEAYKWVYYASIAFGVVSILASCFLGNITKYMTNHVAVVM